MLLHAPAETAHAHGCRVVMRHVDGPEAREYFLLAEPLEDVEGVGAQTEAVYRALCETLAASGAEPAAIVSETILARSIGSDLGAIRAARERIRAEHGAGTALAAVTCVEQPPVTAGSALVVAAQALVPHARALVTERVESGGAGAPGGCADPHAIVEASEPGRRVRAGSVHGEGGDAYAQTVAMFERAEAILARAGLGFRDVVRTWIHLRDIDRDYDAFNRGRRDFFTRRAIDPPPASTGIGGAPPSSAHDLCLGFEAIAAAEGGAPIVMHTPTLNEAPEYGADFTRGMRVVDPNKVALHVSGTASIDEAGHTVHVGDLDAQADRMLRNVAGLLEGQAAGFADVVSAVTYLRDAEDAEALRARLAEAGFTGFPHALVQAPICRPDLLCETEALAILPRR